MIKKNVLHVCLGLKNTAFLFGGITLVVFSLGGRERISLPSPLRLVFKIQVTLRLNIKFCKLIFMRLLKKDNINCFLPNVKKSNFPGMAIFMLWFTLDHPAGDLAAVVPVAVATFTPLPLLFSLVYYR